VKEQNGDQPSTPFEKPKSARKHLPPAGNFPPVGVRPGQKRFAEWMRKMLNIECDNSFIGYMPIDEQECLESDEQLDMREHISNTNIPRDYLPKLCSLAHPTTILDIDPSIIDDRVADRAPEEYRIHPTSSFASTMRIDMEKPRVYTLDRNCDEMVRHQVPYWVEYHVKALTPNWLESMASQICDEINRLNNSREKGSTEYKFPFLLTSTPLNLPIPGGHVAFVWFFDLPSACMLSQQSRNTMRYKRKKNPNFEYFFLNKQIDGAMPVKPNVCSALAGQSPTLIQVGISYLATMKLGRMHSDGLCLSADGINYTEFDPRDCTTLYLKNEMLNMSEQRDEVRVMASIWLQELCLLTLADQYSVDEVTPPLVYPEGAPTSFVPLLKIRVCSMNVGSPYCRVCKWPVWRGLAHAWHCPCHLCAVLLKYLLPERDDILYWLPSFGTEWGLYPTWDSLNGTMQSQWYTAYCTQPEVNAAINGNQMARALTYYCEQTVVNVFRNTLEEWKQFNVNCIEQAEIEKARSIKNSCRYNDFLVCYVPKWLKTRTSIPELKTEKEGEFPYENTKLKREPPKPLIEGAEVFRCLRFLNTYWMGEHVIWASPEGTIKAVYKGHSYVIGREKRPSEEKLAAWNRSRKAGASRPDEKGDAGARGRIAMYTPTINKAVIVNGVIDKHYYKRWIEYLELLGVIAEVENPENKGALDIMLYQGALTASVPLAREYARGIRTSLERRVMQKLTEEFKAVLGQLREAIRRAEMPEGRAGFADGRWGRIINYLRRDRDFEKLEVAEYTALQFAMNDIFRPAPAQLIAQQQQMQQRHMQQQQVFGLQQQQMQQQRAPQQQQVSGLQQQQANYQSPIVRQQQLQQAMAVTHPNMQQQPPGPYDNLFDGPRTLNTQNQMGNAPSEFPMRQMDAAGNVRVYFNPNIDQVGNVTSASDKSPEAKRSRSQTPMDTTVPLHDPRRMPPPPPPPLETPPQQQQARQPLLAAPQAQAQATQSVPTPTPPLNTQTEPACLGDQEFLKAYMKKVEDERALEKKLFDSELERQKLQARLDEQNRLKLLEEAERRRKREEYERRKEEERRAYEQKKYERELREERERQRRHKERKERERHSRSKSHHRSKSRRRSRSSTSSSSSSSSSSTSSRDERKKEKKTKVENLPKSGKGVLVIPQRNPARSSQSSRASATPERGEQQQEQPQRERSPRVTFAEDETPLHP